MGEHIRSSNIFYIL